MSGYHFFGEEHGPICGKPVWSRGHECCCLRVEGHEDACEAVMYKAAEMDGLKFCCRVALDAEHASICWKVTGE